MNAKKTNQPRSLPRPDGPANYGSYLNVEAPLSMASVHKEFVNGTASDRHALPVSRRAMSERTAFAPVLGRQPGRQSHYRDRELRFSRGFG
jgi:hypothetical protein